MSTIFQNFLLQFGYSIGLLTLLGFVIWGLNRLLLRLLGLKAARRLIMATGIVGVPIHEIGHIVFCLVFFHRINKVSLFSFNTRDGTLGYVRHSFNRRNVWQQIGNFFIGVGPLLFGSAVIILLLMLLMPSVVSNVIGTNIWQTIAAIFAPANFINFWWWVFIVIATSVALHMSMSWADIKGSLRGLLFIIPILFVANCILYLFSAGWVAWFTQLMVSVSTLVASFLGIAILLLTVFVLLSGLVRLIFRKRRLSTLAFNANGARKTKKAAVWTKNKNISNSKVDG